MNRSKHGLADAQASRDADVVGRRQWATLPAPKFDCIIFSAPRRPEDT